MFVGHTTCMQWNQNHNRNNYPGLNEQTSCWPEGCCQGMSDPFSLSLILILSVQGDHIEYHSHHQYQHHNQNPSIISTIYAPDFVCYNRHLPSQNVHAIAYE